MAFKGFLKIFYIRPWGGFRCSSMSDHSMIHMALIGVPLHPDPATPSPPTSVFLPNKNPTKPAERAGEPVSLFSENTCSPPWSGFKEDLCHEKSVRPPQKIVEMHSMSGVYMTISTRYHVIFCDVLEMWTLQIIS